MRIHEIIEDAGAAFNRALSKSSGPKQDGPISSFVKGVKTGYTGTQKTIKDLPYTKVGRAARGASQYFQKVNKGPSK